MRSNSEATAERVARFNILPEGKKRLPLCVCQYQGYCAMHDAV